MSRYSSSLAFVDLLFNLLLAFVCLFILSFVMINPKADTGKIDPKAEFIIDCEWAATLDNNTSWTNPSDDIDLWVEDPEGNRVYFGRKEAGLMHLDRDDRGGPQDTQGNTAYIHNKEIVTIRGYIPGEYTVNLHMYSKNTADPASTRVQVIKLNPYKSICDKEVTLNNHHEEVTICRFRVNSSGEVTDTNELPKRLFR